MRLTKAASRVTVVLLLLIIFIATADPVKAFSQTPRQASPQSPQPDSQSIIDRAEAIFHQGEEAHANGQLDTARKLFDEAISIIHESGIDLSKDARLDAYYRQLLERIHKYEAQPGDNHNEQQRPEIVEPSVLDELSNIKDDELAMITPEGIKIYGKYDFDFSVAPPVFQFINFFVTGRGHSTMEVGLQRAGRYRQMVEKIFKEERVPQDLMWLAQAESVWKPNALSRAAAKGIWQFIPSTGLRFGLQQTAWIDDRSQPEKSTRAAARYLRWLYDHFAGDWLLAMAAYNSGENRVDSAIAKCGYADFWELYKRNLLPQETRNYVPIILAITIVSKNQKRYGFNVTPDAPIQFETYELPAQTDLKVVADLIGVPFETMQDLNPELRHGTTPPGQHYTIKLPKGMKKQFEIAYANLPEDQRVRRVIIPREEIAEARGPRYQTQYASYQVRRGDTIASLARRYGVSSRELARANGLGRRGALRAGQTVRIPKAVRASARGRYRESKATRTRLRGRDARSQLRTRDRGSRATSHSRSSRRHRR